MVRTFTGASMLITQVFGAVIMYIDPGAGSIIFQALVGGVMVVGVTAKVYWRKVRRLFQRHG